jgi:hypothetical protein
VLDAWGLTLGVLQAVPSGNYSAVPHPVYFPISPRTLRLAALHLLARQEPYSSSMKTYIPNIHYILRFRNHEFMNAIHDWRYVHPGDLESFPTPLGLPANWRYGRYDQSARATVSHATVFYNRIMDRKRAKGWVNSGAQPASVAVPVKNKTAFFYIREYKSYVVASFLKDKKADGKRIRRLFSGHRCTWLTPGQKFLGL